MMVAARRDEAAPCGGEGVRVRLGIVTPVVNLNPRFDPPEWEERGGIEDVVEVARAAERTGYEWVSCPEHVAIPSAAAGTRGGRYWDPLTTLAYVAASTQSIGLLSHVLVLGYHHPLEVVKRYGTLDMVSGGRVVLGVGVWVPRGGVRPPRCALRGPRGPRRRRPARHPELVLPARPELLGDPLRLRGLRRRAERSAASGPAVGGRPHPPVAAARAGAGRRLDPLRPAPRGPAGAARRQRRRRRHGGAGGAPRRGARPRTAPRSRRRPRHGRRHRARLWRRGGHGPGAALPPRRRAPITSSSSRR